MYINIKLTVNHGFNSSFSNPSNEFYNHNNGRPLGDLLLCSDELKAYADTINNLSILAININAHATYCNDNGKDMEFVINGISELAKGALGIPNDLYFKVTKYTKNKWAISFFMCTVTVIITK
jgi:hypothetical protein